MSRRLVFCDRMTLGKGRIAAFAFCCICIAANRLVFTSPILSKALYECFKFLNSRCLDDKGGVVGNP